MKTNLITTAGALACIFATTTMPLSAEEINSAISGTSISLGFGTIGTSPVPVPLGNVLHATSIPLKKNGKKFNKQGSTSITNSMTTPVGFNPACYSPDRDEVGILFSYDYSYAVSTRPNGDLVSLQLDPQPDLDDPLKVSKLCAYGPPDFAQFEATVYQKITGGSGEFENACGWVETSVKGTFLGEGSTLSAYEGTQVGEIFVGDDCL